MTKTIRDLIADISRADLTDAEIRVLWQLLKDKHSQLARRTTRSLLVGDTVEFPGRYGSVLRGTITKINAKTVGVRVVDNGRPVNWRVNSALIKKVA